MRLGQRSVRKRSPRDASWATSGGRGRAMAIPLQVPGGVPRVKRRGNVGAQSGRGVGCVEGLQRGAAMGGGPGKLNFWNPGILGTRGAQPRGNCGEAWPAAFQDFRLAGFQDSAQFRIPIGQPIRISESAGGDGPAAGPLEGPCGFISDSVDAFPPLQDDGVMETQERIEGPTPNGGAYAIAFWHAEDGSPTDKESAVTCEVVEYDANDQVVFRTYATLK